MRLRSTAGLFIFLVEKKKGSFRPGLIEISMLGGWANEAIYTPLNPEASILPV